MSYTVRRVREIGIRLALGASGKTVLRSVLRDALTLALTGVILGGAAALLLTSFASAFVYGLSAHDPITFVTVSAILVAIMVAAAYLPARRAAHLDPMYALRAE